MLERRTFSDDELRLRSIRYRQDVLRYITAAGAGHTGGSLSCIDILNVLYNRVLRVSPSTFASDDRDRYVQSKGHSVEALYVVLAHAGFFQIEQLETLCRYQSPFVGHPTRKVAGIEMNTGALGHGLPICVGMAIGAKLCNKSYRVFTLLGDGELAEGSNWEAAMAAAHYRLDNLTAIVDHNTLQITGPTASVCRNDPLEEKFASFGWSVLCIDGHDICQITEALATRAQSGKPTCIIANTIKGRGVTFMEGEVAWHHGVPNDAQYTAAMAELVAAEKHALEAQR